VQGQPKIDKSSKKQTEYVQYTLKPIEALDDVDADALDSIDVATNASSDAR
jgi:hypothetical protein